MFFYIYILTIIALTTYGQLVVKWRMSQVPTLPVPFKEKVFFLIKYAFTDFFILSGFAAAFTVALMWMTLINKMPLNVAYPFMSLTFITVPILSSFLFNESLSMNQIIGITLICSGVATISLHLK